MIIRDPSILTSPKNNNYCSSSKIIIAPFSYFALATTAFLDFLFILSYTYFFFSYSTPTTIAPPNCSTLVVVVPSLNYYS
jgi:hypothetical protein